MRQPICAFLIALLTLTSAAVAADIHVDAANGSDTNAGSKDRPLKSLSAAMAKATGGDSIYLQPGNYGEINDRRGPGKHLYTGKYVTIQPAPGIADSRKKITIGRMQYGVRTGNMTGEGRKGVFDLYLRVKGMRFADGIYIYGGRHFEAIDCRIERIGPHTGSAENIEKFAVAFGAGDDLNIKDSEITNTAGGAVISGSRNRIINTEIHDIAHDGIRAVSSKDSLIEGCRIYNLDDGVDDNDPRGKGWNRHCDAIHIFIPGPGVPGAQNTGLTIRNNFMYNCESQAIQFNNYLRKKDLWNEQITIENNVFGPTRANVINIADPVDGIIVRHNTYVYFPEGRTFRGRDRDIECKNHTFRISGACRKAQVYNNLFVSAGIAPRDGWFVSHNFIAQPTNVQPIGRFDIAGVDPQFVNPEAFDGRLKPTSPAIDAGTTTAPADAFATGIHGTKRDARPDMGAVEMPNHTPAAEAKPPTATEPIRTFVDDFADGDFIRVDPWLAGPNRQGLAWKMLHASDDKSSFDIMRRDKAVVLNAPMGAVQAIIATTTGDDWKNYDFSFQAHNAYVTKGGGPLFLLRDANTYYWLDISRDNGRLLRSLPGEDGKPNIVELAPAPKVQMPHHGERDYRIGVRHEAGAIVITVDADADGTTDFEYRDTDAAAIKAMPSGRIGFRRDAAKMHHRLQYDDIKVELK